MNGTVPLPIERPHLSRLGWYGGTVLALLVWALVYPQLPALAEALVAVLPVERTSPAGEALWFFLYDAPKVLMLLTLVVFAMGVVRSFVSAKSARGSATSWPPGSARPRPSAPARRSRSSWAS